MFKKEEIEERKIGLIYNDIDSNHDKIAMDFINQFDNKIFLSYFDLIDILYNMDEFSYDKDIAFLTLLNKELELRNNILYSYDDLTVTFKVETMVNYFIDKLDYFYSNVYKSIGYMLDVLYNIKLNDDDISKFSIWYIEYWENIAESLKSYYKIGNIKLDFEHVKNDGKIETIVNFNFNTVKEKNEFFKRYMLFL